MTDVFVSFESFIFKLGSYFREKTSMTHTNHTIKNLKFLDHTEYCLIGHRKLDTNNPNLYTLGCHIIHNNLRLKHSKTCAKKGNDDVMSKNRPLQLPVMP